MSNLPEPAVTPQSSTLRYKANGAIEPGDLGKIVEEVHHLVCGTLPGTAIKKMSFDGYDLVIEVAS